MADEAFALSPINARAAQPNDADYDAICSAFMETARGRWFLGEYTKRNRNTDTRLVLDAVARLEANLESQKQAQAAQSVRPADLWPELAKMLATTRIEIAQRLLREGHDAGLETIHAGAEAVRSVSWALRERGFDSRICDVFDTQVKALLQGHAALAGALSANADSNTHVLEAVDHLIEFARGLLTDQADKRKDEVLLDEMVDAVAGAMADDGAFDESSVFDGDQVEHAREVETIADIAARTAATEGVLEISDDDAASDIVDMPVPEPLSAPVLSEPEINRQRLYEAKMESYAVAAAPADEPPSRPDAEKPDEAALSDSVSDVQVESTAPAAPARATSLGHALLASGAVARPGDTRPDPLAPFRRMSQAEKIAFFS